MALITRAVNDASRQVKVAPEWYNPRFYALDFDVCPPSIGNLDPSITLNGVTSTPDFRWKGKDAAATWTYWGYGADLILQTGTPGYNYGSLLAGSQDGSVKLPGTSNAWYNTAGTSLGNFGTKDWLLEAVLETTNVTSDCLINKLNTPDLTLGWLLWLTGSGQVCMQVKKAGVGSGYCQIASAATPAGLYHILIMCNRNVNWGNGGVEIYINGVASSVSTEGNFADFSMSLDTAEGLRVGLAPAVSYSYSAIHSLAGWAYQDWFNGADTAKTEWGLFAKDRFAQLAATKALVAPLGSPVPSVCTRSTGGYLDKIESDGTTKLYVVGANWPRVCSRYSKRTNLILQSEDQGTTWASSFLTFSSNGALAPNWQQTADGIKPTTDNQFHLTLQTVGSLAASLYCYSLFAKYNGNEAWLGLSDDSLGAAANCTALFNVQNGTLGVIGALLAGYGIVPYPNGWYRCFIYFTAAAGDNQFRNYAQRTNGLAAYAGDATVGQWWWGAQLERGARPTDYITTTDAASTVYGPQIVRGYLSETAGENKCLQSHTLGSWAYLDNITVPATSVVCPDGVARTTVTLHEDSTPGVFHGVEQYYQTTAAQWVESCWFKAVNRTWARLGFGDESCFFNLSTGAVGTRAGPHSAKSQGIVPYGNGWYRCYMTWLATVENRTISLIIGESDNDYTFDGLNQDSIYAFGSQLELGSYPTSYMPTTTSSATRAVDSLVYKLNDGNWNPSVGGEISCNLLLPNIDQPVQPVYFYANDGGDDNGIALSAPGVGDDFATATIRSGASYQAQIAGTTDLWNNAEHALTVKCRPNSASLWVDGAQEGSTDTSVTLPVGMTKIDVGGHRTAGYELNGLISKVRID